MAETKPEAIKLRKITIDNIKVIDHLELEFPEPLMKGDPDVLVLGSKNGFGKTSVLESCALLLTAVVLGKGSEHDLMASIRDLDVLGPLIRSGHSDARIEATFVLADEFTAVKVSFSQSSPTKLGKLTLVGKTLSIEGRPENSFRNLNSRVAEYDPPPIEALLYSLRGYSTDPLVIGPFIYFHSYRKVQERSPALADIIEGSPPGVEARDRREITFPVSRFKMEVLKSMMTQAGLLESENLAEHEESLGKLNELLKRYAGGELGKLRPQANNTLDFRVSTGPDGPTFSFDGLSSGQKEIISTLYLIWRHTRNRPGIVLIDEPELHLNHEWHRDFVRQLHNLAPDNQYILATHSEDIFASVPEDRRVLLEISKDQGA